MRIIFVRHGHPNYEKDCLTELGHRHAEAAAERLKDEKIQRIFSSPLGRAYETAEHIADPFGLDIEVCGFMREIGWRSIDGTPIFQDGHPWFTVDRMVSEGQSVMDASWNQQEPFCNNKVIDCAKNVVAGLDEWLASLGYERDGLYYRVCNGNEDTVVMASHGGSSSVAIAHLFNLPFPFVCTAIKLDFTSISIVSLKGENGSLISPEIEILNDARHIAHMSGDKEYGQ